MAFIANLVWHVIKSSFLSEIIPMIARLGGHLGRKHDGEPGPTSIWIGLQRMRDFLLVLDAIKNVQRIPSEDIPVCV